MDSLIFLITTLITFLGGATFGWCICLLAIGKGTTIKHIEHREVWEQDPDAWKNN